MPVHDWTRVDVGTYHSFRFGWVAAIANRLNQGGLPHGYYAMLERDELHPKIDPNMPDSQAYSILADRIAVHHKDKHLVAVIEIVSPGNKDNHTGLRVFVDRVVCFLNNGVHVLIVDIFPSGTLSATGIHNVVWRHFKEQHATWPTDKPLGLLAYCAKSPVEAYVEPFAASDAMLDMPLFLTDQTYVSVPLEASYQAAWKALPEPIRELFE